MLGVTGGTAYQRAHYGQGVDPIWMDNVQCQGHEASLSDCRANPMGVENCGHSEDAGVYCGKDLLYRGIYV